MNAAAEQVAKECTEGSDDGSLTFPQVVQKLMAAGVERYHADLRRAEKIYYMPGGESFVTPSATLKGNPAQNFSAAGVEAAVRAIQQGKTSYAAFCEQINAAGCVGYFVSLAGRRAVYYGRTCETYVEPFPGAK
jgi:uncharacterized protein YbcV (DUF1398 family)